MGDGLAMNGLGVSILILGGYTVYRLIRMVVERREDLLPIWMPLIFGAVVLCYPFPEVGVFALLVLTVWLVAVQPPERHRESDDL